MVTLLFLYSPYLQIYALLSTYIKEYFYKHTNDNDNKNDDNNNYYNNDTYHNDI